MRVRTSPRSVFTSSPAVSRGVPASARLTRYSQNERKNRRQWDGVLKCTDCSLPVPSRDQCSRSAAHLLRHAGATTLGVRPPATASATCSTIGTTPARVTINRVTTMDRATLGTIAGPFALAARVMDGAAGEPFVCVLASPPHKRFVARLRYRRGAPSEKVAVPRLPASSRIGIAVARNRQLPAGTAASGRGGGQSPRHPAGGLAHGSPHRP